MKEEYNHSGFKTSAIIIIVLGSIIALNISIQFVTHYHMMMRWYKENPIFEQKIVRSIKVGLAPDEPAIGEIMLG